MMFKGMLTAGQVTARPFYLIIITPSRKIGNEVVYICIG